MSFDGDDKSIEKWISKIKGENQSTNLCKLTGLDTASRDREKKLRQPLAHLKIQKDYATAARNSQRERILNSSPLSLNVVTKQLQPPQQ